MGRTSSSARLIFRFLLILPLLLLPAMVSAQVATPVLTPDDGVYWPLANGGTSFNVTITCATGGAEIRYRTDGADPTLSDALIASGASVTVNRGMLLKAKAWSGGVGSAVATGAFTVNHTIAAGDFSSFALHADGRLYAWGKNAQGRLGLGASAGDPQLTPAIVATHVIGVDGGAEDTSTTPNGHMVFVKDDGTVWCAGSNVYGQLGNLSNTNSSTPVQVKLSGGAFLTNVVAVAAGNGSSFALTADGYVYSWGQDGAQKRLGDNFAGNRNYASRVKLDTGADLSGIVEIASGDDHTLARTAGGQVYAWGSHNVGQLGIGNTGDAARDYATLVTAGVSGSVATAPLSGIVSIAAGGSHSMAVRGGDGAVFGWGQTSHGRIGDGNGAATPSTPAYRPKQTEESGTNLPCTNAVKVAAGGSHTLILKANGTVYACGNDNWGQVGDPTTSTTRGRAIVVTANSGANLTGIADIAAGAHHSLAISTAGQVYAWGHADSGQLGNGSAATASVGVATQSTPVPIMLNRTPSITSFTVSPVGSLVQPATLTFNIGATDSDNNISRVDISNGGTFLGTASYISTVSGVSNYQFPLSNVAAGTYSYTATVVDAAGATASATSAQTVALPKVWVQAVNASPAETSSTPGTFQFMLEKAQTTAVTVNFTIVGSATESVDYNALARTVTFPAGTTTQNVNVIPIQDAEIESTETVMATVTSGTNYILNSTQTSATVNIVNDSPKVSVSAEVSDARENGVTPVPGKFRFTRSGSLPAQTISYSLTGNAIRGVDYYVTAPVGTVSFSQGEGVKDVDITPIPDSVPEVTETVVLTITPKSTYVITAPGNATVTIADAPPAEIPKILFGGRTFDSDGTWVATPDILVETVMLVSAPGRMIYYTVDGTEPTPNTPTKVASGGVVRVPAGAVVYAKVFGTDLYPSETVTAWFHGVGSVAAGSFHSMLIDQNGVLWSWGANNSGQLGLGDLNDATEPTPVNLWGNSVARAAAGAAHSVALVASGDVYAWGDNSYGQLGGTPIEPEIPSQVAGLPGAASAVAAGSSLDAAFSAALVNGQVYTWGDNSYGQLGLLPDPMNPISQRITPGVVKSKGGGVLSGVVAIAAGDMQMTALTSSKEVWTWGTSSWGMPSNAGLPDDPVLYSTPVAVKVTQSNTATAQPLTGIVAIAMGKDHTLALHENGTVWAWGSNFCGQLGVRTSSYYSTDEPVQVKLANGTLLSGVIAISAGSYTSQALKADGTVMVWGARAGYQLGDGVGYSSDENWQDYAVMVPGLANVVALAAGTDHVLAARWNPLYYWLPNAASYWAWGKGNKGQLGTGNRFSASVPTPVKYPYSDSDGDGLPDWQENDLGTYMYSPDSNGNGWTDLEDYLAGLDPNNQDYDGDGVLNYLELQLGTNPYQADSDGDGVNDLDDVYPLDPLRSSYETPDSNDTTPPVITLIRPVSVN